MQGKVTVNQTKQNVSFFDLFTLMQLSAFSLTVCKKTRKRYGDTSEEMTKLVAFWAYVLIHEYIRIMKALIGTLFFFLFTVSELQAHEGQNEAQTADTTSTTQHSEGEPHGHGGSGPQHQESSSPQHQESSDSQKGWDHPEKVTADFEDFPNLHPLFVHFPVVLLPFAAFFQLLGLFIFKREISWVALILAIGGIIGGYVAASFVHPHVGDLPQHAQQVYDKHAMYATWTLWLGGIAVLLKLISHFALHRKLWSEGVVAAVLLASAYTVSMAGHHGSQLVFIEGVGPQGKYLETESGGGHSH